ncbi:SRPBCC domain-containing protein [Micromonospora sediminicola]|uniref:SRPBCC domain-containing protein n=1 Tax=Micromonospora sediminicola TaxID=946078 RepID=UPI0033F30447
MTRTDLSNDATTMFAEGDILVIERTFSAPRELVWEMLTSPEHVARWWGPRGTTTDVARMDVRPGGVWRWINKFDGGQAAFTGEYLEVAPPHRLVRTSIFDDGHAEGPGAVETVTLEEQNGTTKVIYHTRFPSDEVLSFALSQGMSMGALEQFDRLAELLEPVA